MKRLALLSLSALTLSAIYLYAWPSANVFYAGVVLVHVGLGVLFCIGGLRLLPYASRQPAIVKLATLVLIIGFTDAVHLMIDIRRERAAGMSPLLKVSRPFA